MSEVCVCEWGVVTGVHFHKPAVSLSDTIHFYYKHGNQGERLFLTQRRVNNAVIELTSISQQSVIMVVGTILLQLLNQMPKNPKTLF